MVTLMRTSKEECEQVGAWIGKKLKSCVKDPSMVQVWMPANGVSMIDVPDAPFWNQEADTALWHSLMNAMLGSRITVQSSPTDVNDEQFATAMADTLLQLIQEKREGSG